MGLMRLTVGFALFLLGLGYLFQPQMILRFNAFMREHFFRDSHVLLANRRIGVLLLLVSFLLLVVGLRPR